MTKEERKILGKIYSKKTLQSLDKLIEEGKKTEKIAEEIEKELESMKKETVN